MLAINCWTICESLAKNALAKPESESEEHDVIVLCQLSTFAVIYVFELVFGFPVDPPVLYNTINKLGETRDCLSLSCSRSEHFN